MDNSYIEILLFINNALNDGWSVMKLSNNKYTFTKKNINVEEINLNAFINNNMKLVE